MDFLLRIKKDEISIEDISNLVGMLDDKNLVNNLPIELHKYGSYYTLMKDMFYTRKKMFLLKEIKDNLSAEQKKIILSLINDESIKEDLEKILHNEELKSTFYRWSSRIKNTEFAKNYIQAVISDSYLLKELNGQPSDLIELKKFNTDSKYIPACWCIKNEQTFRNYITSQRIFILKYKKDIYGVNLSKECDLGLPGNQRLNYISIIDSKNKSIFRGQGMDDIFDKAKSEILKFDIFGTKSDKTGLPNRGTKKNLLKRIFNFK